MTKPYYASAVALLCATLAGGCSEGVTRLSPSGPTPAAVMPSSALGAFADRSSPAWASPNDAGAVVTWAATHGWAVAADGLLVEGTDLIAAIDGTCPEATITVRGVPVSLTSTTSYASPLTCETLATGMKVKITGLLTFESPSLSVTATHIAPEDSSETPTTPGGPGGPGAKKARGEGTIGAITGACPSLTLIITGTRVQTSDATEYVNGTCETLRPGTKVRIDGELNPGGDATAEKIDILRTPGKPVSGDGKVDEVTGTCPALTLTVRGVTVTTSSSTTFTGGTCEDIVPGSQINVTGDYDGTSVEALAVKVKISGTK